MGFCAKVVGPEKEDKMHSIHPTVGTSMFPQMSATETLAELRGARMTAMRSGRAAVSFLIVALAAFAAMNGLVGELDFTQTMSFRAFALVATGAAIIYGFKGFLSWLRSGVLEVDAANRGLSTEE
jgi:small-conductance mechanosensitive channel